MLIVKIEKSDRPLDKKVLDCTDIVAQYKKIRGEKIVQMRVVRRFGGALEHFWDSCFCFNMN